MFVTYVDESGNSGAIFVVGSLTSTSEKWDAFSTEWQQILDLYPKIESFKFSDVSAFSNAGRKVPDLINVINKYVDRGDLGIIHINEYKKLFSGKIGATFDFPYHKGYVGIIAQTALAVSKRERAGKIDFIFDEISSTEYIELVSAFQLFKKSCPNPDVVAVLDKEPVMDSDEKILQLQAADLFAGVMRRAYEDKSKEALALIKSIKIESRAFIWDETKLRELFSRSAKREPLFGQLYENAKQRSKRLKLLRRMFNLGKNSS